MSIKLKLSGLIFIVSIAFILSIAIYIIITSPIDRILKEQQSLEGFVSTLNIVLVEATKILTTTSLEEQSLKFNQAVEEMQLEFDRIKEFTVLSKLNLNIQVAMEKIHSRKLVMIIQTGEYQDRIYTILEQAKILFGNTENISILDFYNYYKDEVADRLFQDSVYFNIALLFNQISVLNKNVYDSINIAKDEFIVIDGEIGKIQTDSILISLISIGIVLTSGILFSLIISNSITKSIKKIEGNIVLLNEGNLTAEFKVKSKDEIGILSCNLDMFLSTLSSSIIRIKEASSKNLNIKNELINAINQTSSSLIEMDASIKSIKGQISMLDDGIQTSSRSSENIFTNINELNNQLMDQNSMTEETASAITEMISSLENIAKITQSRKKTTDCLVITAQSGGEKLTQTVDIITNINQSLSNISEVTKVIQGIAARTNLLSLNAAIEAAHAGDAGKGFSIVAQEIGKLAEAANIQSKKISIDLKDIIHKIGDASESSIETSTAFKKIDEEIRTVNDSLVEIFNNMDELQTGSRQILEAIQNLRDTSLHVKDASNEISHNSIEASNSMTKVKDISSSVRSSISEVSAGITEISNATNKTNDLSGEISKVIENLDRQVNQFKTSNNKINENKEELQNVL